MKKQLAEQIQHLRQRLIKEPSPTHRHMYAESIAAYNTYTKAEVIVENVQNKVASLDAKKDGIVSEAAAYVIMHAYNDIALEEGFFEQFDDETNLMLAEIFDKTIEVDNMLAEAAVKAHRPVEKFFEAFNEPVTLTEEDNAFLTEFFFNSRRKNVAAGVGLGALGAAAGVAAVRHSAAQAAQSIPSATQVAGQAGVHAAPHAAAAGHSVLGSAMHAGGVLAHDAGQVAHGALSLGGHALGYGLKAGAAALKFGGALALHHPLIAGGAVAAYGAYRLAKHFANKRKNTSVTSATQTATGGADQQQHGGLPMHTTGPAMAGGVGGGHGYGMGGHPLIQNNIYTGGGFGGHQGYHGTGYASASHATHGAQTGGSPTATATATVNNFGGGRGERRGPSIWNSLRRAARRWSSSVGGGRGTGGPSTADHFDFSDVGRGTAAPTSRAAATTPTPEKPTGTFPSSGTTGPKERTGRTPVHGRAPFMDDAEVTKVGDAEIAKDHAAATPTPAADAGTARKPAASGGGRVAQKLLTHERKIPPYRQTEDRRNAGMPSAGQILRSAGASTRVPAAMTDDRASYAKSRTRHTKAVEQAVRRTPASTQRSKLVYNAKD